jgi:rhodanese-related sulfurtransferase
MNLEYGCCSRSLIACHELIVKGGYPNVVHVDGGFSRWANRQLPGEADV